MCTKVLLATYVHANRLGSAASKIASSEGEGETDRGGACMQVRRRAAALGSPPAARRAASGSNMLHCHSSLSLQGGEKGGAEDVGSGEESDRGREREMALHCSVGWVALHGGAGPGATLQGQQ